MSIISLYKIFSLSLCSIIVDTLNGKDKKTEINGSPTWVIGERFLSEGITGL